MELNNRKREIIAGILFFVATLSYGVGDLLITNNLIKGSILESLNIISIILIAILLSPIFKKINTKLGKFYLLTRCIEGLFLSISIISIWFISKEFYSIFFQIAMLFLSVGSLILLYRLYLKKSLNLIFIILGISGYIGLGIWSILEFLSLPNTMLLFAPGAIFEIIFPLFLIFKGFSK